MFGMSTVISICDSVPEPPVKETFIRNGSDDDRTILRHKLELLQSNLPKLFGDKSELSPVTIKGLIDNCDRIFTISEAVEYGMIWLLDTAQEVMKIFDEIFCDILMPESSESESDSN